MTEEIPLSRNSKATLTPTMRRTPKRWVMAKRKHGDNQQQRTNETLEGEFMRMVAKVKQLIKGQAPIVFERDYRKDNTDSFLAMHGFMTDSIHLYLECGYDYFYRLEYAFYKCPHEQAIRKMLSAYVFEGRATEIELKPDFPTFFKNVQAYQPKQYIYSL